MKHLDCLSGLVFTTHMLDDFECLSARDYVDTKSWLAYEQNPSCPRETFLGYDILLAVTQLRADMNI
jgi:hypothetical protein